MRAELVHVFAALNADRNVKVAILTGAGERAFCAGLDLKELGAGGAIGNGYCGTGASAACNGRPEPVSAL